MFFQTDLHDCGEHVPHMCGESYVNHIVQNTLTLKAQIKKLSKNVHCLCFTVIYILNCITIELNNSEIIKTLFLQMVSIRDII